MATASMRNFLAVRNQALRGKRLRALSAFLSIVFAGLIAAGCSPKVVRVPVSSEDLIRSNEVSKEGDIAFARKDFYAALIKYLEASRLNPNNEYIFNRIGISYSQLNYYQEAAAAFNRSIALNSKYPYSVNNLGSVYFALKDLKKSEKYFRKAVSMNRDEPSFHMNLGTLYFEKKDYGKAMVEWRRGLALDPEILSKSSSNSLIGGSTPSRERSYFMARLHASAGNVPRVIEHLERAFTEGFTDIEAIQKEPDFDPVRKDERFVEFMKNLELLIKLKSSGAQEGEATPAPPGQAPDGGIRKPKVTIGTQP
jgi:tetratricopeptide (TPR) repeat protein